MIERVGGRREKVLRERMKFEMIHGEPKEAEDTYAHRSSMPNEEKWLSRLNAIYREEEQRKRRARGKRRDSE